MGNFRGWKAFRMSSGKALPEASPGQSSSFAIWAASTIAVSAFLLFQVQPIISKMILPWFGGSSAVWSTCMLFFQMVLLAGYGYAHWLTRTFQPRRQVMIHVGLMLLAVITLPITPGDYWRPADGNQPALRILMVLGRHVGLPYFLLSTTGPLVQAWFGRVYSGRSPYRLYALSNIGSLTALLSYPFLFEPMFTSSQQDWWWSTGFVVFAVLNATLAWHLWRFAGRSLAPSTVKANDEAGVPTVGNDLAVPAPGVETKLMWVVLPALASVALLAVTNHLSQDVAAVPFLWVIPLSLYLLSFIITFDHDRWYVRGFFTSAALLCILAICVIESAPALDKHAERMGWPAMPTAVIDDGMNAMVGLVNRIPGVKIDRFSAKQFDYNPTYQGLFYLASLFLGCMVCHGELARLKPARQHLTEYFLMISAGGALGGVFVALMCPVLFVWYAELPLAQAGIFLVAGVTLGLMLFPRMKGDHPTNKWLRFGLCAVALASLATLSGNAAVKNVESQTVRGLVPLLLAFVGAALAYGIIATSRRELQVMCSAIAGLLMLSGLFGLVLGNTIRVPDPAIVAARRSFYGALQVKDDLITGMELDGRGEIRLKSDGTLLDPNESFTLEYWFRRSETESVLISLMQVGELDITLATGKNGEEPIAWCHVGSSRSSDKPWNLADQEWHHISVSSDGTAVRLYVDGQPMHNVTLEDIEVRRLSPVVLARSGQLGATNLAGEMHSVKLREFVSHRKAQPFAPPPFESTQLPEGVELALDAVETKSIPEGRWLLHGRIQHGYQHLGPAISKEQRAQLPVELWPLRYQPATYYAPESGIGLAIRRHPRAGKSMKIAVVGLGSGTIAAFGQPGDEIRFYEIDQTVVDLATDYFTYRSDSLANTSVALGDARLQMESEPPQNYDVIAVDAFSGDAIPVHLLTRECLEVYQKHLSDGGILAIHISNRYLDLAPIVRAMAQRGEMRVENFHYHEQKGPLMDTQSEWMLLTRSTRFFEDEEVQRHITKPRDQRLIQWTDQYSNLRDILQ